MVYFKPFSAKLNENAIFCLFLTKVKIFSKVYYILNLNSIKNLIKLLLISTIKNNYHQYSKTSLVKFDIIKSHGGISKGTNFYFL